MQTRERRLAIMPPVKRQTDTPAPTPLDLPGVERMLVAALTAAREAAALCEGALALLAESQQRELPALLFAPWDTRDNAGSRHAAEPERSGHGSALTVQFVTPREKQVLLLIAAGASNKEIALELRVSVRTVERHITNVYRKIGARGKADATAWVVRHHLV